MAENTAPRIVAFPPTFAEIVGVALIALAAVIVARQIPGLKSWV